MPGYLPTLPVVPDKELVEAAKIAAADKYEVDVIDDGGSFSGGSTDVGDLQHIQPVYTFNTGGINGKFHGADFEVVDEELAYIQTAKVFALSAYRFLRDNAGVAKKIVKEYEPKLSKDEYIKLLDSFIKTEIREFE